MEPSLQWTYIKLNCGRNFIQDNTTTKTAFISQAQVIYHCKVIYRSKFLICNNQVTNRVFFIVISLMLVIYSWYMVACIISCLPQPSPQCWWLQLWWKGHTPSSWSPPTPLSNTALSAPHAHLYLLTSIDLIKWLCVSVFCRFHVLHLERIFPICWIAP